MSTAAPLRPHEATGAISDLRCALESLRAEGDLIETDQEVDPDLEITGLQKHLAGGA